MTAKEWLSQARYMYMHVRDLEEEYKFFFELATNTTSAPTDAKVQKSTINSYDRKMARLADLSASLDAERVRLLEVLREIEATLSKVPEPYQAILRKRYLRFMRWDRVADELHYSVRQVHRYHGQALRIVQKLRGF